MLMEPPKVGHVLKQFSKKHQKILKRFPRNIPSHVSPSFSLECQHLREVFHIVSRMISLRTSQLDALKMNSRCLSRLSRRSSNFDLPMRQQPKPSIVARVCSIHPMDCNVKKEEKLNFVGIFDRHPNKTKKHLRSL